MQKEVADKLASDDITEITEDMFQVRVILRVILRYEELYGRVIH